MLSKVMMRFTWIDCETGDKDENLFGANGQNDWDKGVGSALTYAERYFLLKYFHINTDEDDIDNPDRKPQEEAQPLQTIQVAINEMKAVKNVEEMGAIWKKYPALQKNDEFVKVKDERKSTLNIK